MGGGRQRKAQGATNAKLQREDANEAKKKGGRPRHDPAYRAALEEATISFAKEIQRRSRCSQFEIELNLGIGSAKRTPAEGGAGTFSKYLNGRDSLGAEGLVELAMRAHKIFNAEGEPWLSHSSLAQIRRSWGGDVKLGPIYKKLEEDQKELALVLPLYRKLRTCVSALSRYAVKRGIRYSAQLERPLPQLKDFTEEGYLNAIKREILITIDDLAIATQLLKARKGSVITPPSPEEERMLAAASFRRSRTR